MNNWYVLTPYNQEWYPYGLAEGNVILHPKGADTDMSDMTMRELLDVFGAVTVLSKAKD